MANPPPLRGGPTGPRRSSAGRAASPARPPAEDSWGPATAVRTNGERADASRNDAWSPATPVRVARPAPRPGPRADVRSPMPAPVAAPPPIGDAWAGPPRAPGPSRDAAQRLAGIGRRQPRERGLPWVAALLLLIAIAGVGGLIDTISGAQVRGGFNVGIIVASVVAILAVRRSGMFPIIIAPPLVYAIASAAMLYVRSGGLKDKHVLFDAAANWLVYGFPAIAGATAAVLVIAGIRLTLRR